MLDLIFSYRHLFSDVLNMSLTASLMIVFVLLTRLALKKAPKIYSYILWSVVLFRLLCPVSLAAPASLLGLMDVDVPKRDGMTTTVQYVEYDELYEREPVIAENPVGNNGEVSYGQTLGEPEKETKDFRVAFLRTVPWIWAMGVLGMMAVSLIQWLRLKRRLVVCSPLRKNIYLADDIDSPFVMGILRPRIYLPTRIRAGEREYILAHERHHIRRGDHIIKLLAYLALSIHWFNPLVWIAFLCAGKDMEMSCDEAVIKRLGSDIRADYSATLLRMTTHRYSFAITPLAFGEGDTKGRIMNMAKWKKPKIWVSAVCIILCTAVLVACGVNPEKAAVTENTNFTEPTDAVEMEAGLNIRKEPSTMSAPIGQYAHGTEITILETKDGWGRTDQGWVHMEYVKTTDGITVVDTSAFQAPVDDSIVRTDTELVQYGTLKMLLPDGFAATYQNDTAVLTKDSVPVGGIRQWLYPDFQPSDIVELRKEESGVPIGYMSGSSAYGDMEYEIFWDGNPDGLSEQHTFFTDGDTIYDVWYDENQISAGIAESFLKTVAINAEPVIAENPKEQAAFAKCRAVLDAVQNGSYKIVSRQINSGAQVPNGFVHTYSKSNEDWLSTTTVISEVGNTEDGLVGEKYDVTSSTLCANGKRFCFTGAEWVEITYSSDSLIPWLATFQWDDSVAYMDTLTKEDGECVMLRVDQHYNDSDEYDPHYFLYFNFDPDGNFVNAQLQINLFRENELSITESIVSLDAETVNAEIQAEYQKAIG